jgi:hypothetical protein
MIWDDLGEFGEMHCSSAICDFFGLRPIEANNRDAGSILLLRSGKQDNTSTKKVASASVMSYTSSDTLLAPARCELCQ